MLRQSIAENVVSVRALTLGRDGFVLRNERLTNAATERHDGTRCRANHGSLLPRNDR
jgi:hypothetical protein